MDINKCVELYKLMADNCKISGFRENQAKVYSEMTDFIAGCSSIEEAMDKIKNSKYYLAPSEALVKDKLIAWILAAQENGMEDVAQVYQDKLQKIENNQNEMYIPGYETEAQNLKSKYIITMQAFSSVFNAYITYLSTRDIRNLQDLLGHLHMLSKPFSDFEELSKLQQFRSLIPLNDNGYKSFVADIVEFQKTGELHIKASIVKPTAQEQPNNVFSIFRKKSSSADTQINIDDDFAEIKFLEDKINDIGKNVLANTHKSQVLVTAPNVDVEDLINNDEKFSELKYEYSEEKVI